MFRILHTMPRHRDSRHWFQCAWVRLGAGLPAAASSTHDEELSLSSTAAGGRERPHTLRAEVQLSVAMSPRRDSGNTPIALSSPSALPQSPPLPAPPRLPRPWSADLLRGIAPTPTCQMRFLPNKLVTLRSVPLALPPLPFLPCPSPFPCPLVSLPSPPLPQARPSPIPFLHRSIRQKRR